MTDQIHFTKALFDACPTGVLAMDHQSCIRWLNPALEQMLNLTGDQLVGKDRTTLPPELHAIFDDTDVLHLTLGDESERWLQRDVRTVKNGNGHTLHVHYYQDISSLMLSQRESEFLRQQVDELTITDELTGLANRRATIQALDIQVTRSRRYGNPLTLGVARIAQPDSQMERLADNTVLTFSQYLRERLRWADIIGRYEADTFLLLMPETSLDDALQLLFKIQAECRDGALKGLQPALYPSIQVGASTWEKGDDPQRLISRTLQTLRSE